MWVRVTCKCECVKSAEIKISAHSKMDCKKIARGVGMLALQHVVHYASVQLHHNWCAYSVWGSFLTHGSYVCMGLEEFNRNKLGLHVLLLAREFM